MRPSCRRRTRRRRSAAIAPRTVVGAGPDSLPRPPRILSLPDAPGLQRHPALGDLHIGNYLGRSGIGSHSSPSHECIFSIVDLHASRSRTSRRTGGAHVRDGCGLLAAAFDPNAPRCSSSRRAAAHGARLGPGLRHALRRAGADDPVQGQGRSRGNVPAGLLNYPVLQRPTSCVPGRSRAAARTSCSTEPGPRRSRDGWNARFGTDLPEPQPILSKARRIVGLDGKSKMSKSVATPSASWTARR